MTPDQILARYHALPARAIDIVEVVYDYGSQDQSNIVPLAQGEIVYVLDKLTSGWWDGVVFKDDHPDPAEATPVRGWFPQLFTRPTPYMALVLLRQAASHESLLSLTLSAKISNLEPLPTLASLQNLRILSVRDAERLQTARLGLDPGFWLPQLGPDGKTLFYNADLDVYCTERPFSLALSSIDFLLPLSPLIPPSEPKEEAESSRRAAKLVSFFKSTLKTQPQTQPKRPPKPAPLFAQSTEETPKSIKDAASHFIAHPTDITSFPVLESTIDQLLDRCSTGVSESDSRGFFLLFALVARLTGLVRVWVRLDRDKLVQLGLEPQVRKRLGQISRAVARTQAAACAVFEHKGETKSEVELFRESVMKEAPFKEDALFGTSVLRTDSTASSATLRSDLDCVAAEMRVIRRHVHGCGTVLARLLPHPLPQIYPRFLAGFYCGGAWMCPLLGPEAARELPRRSSQTAVLSKSNAAALAGRGARVCALLEEAQAHARTAPERRSLEAASSVYCALAAAAHLLEVFESVDAGVAPPAVLVAYYAARQDMHNALGELLMALQLLGAHEASAFRAPESALALRALLGPSVVGLDFAQACKEARKAVDALLAAALQLAEERAAAQEKRADLSDEGFLMEAKARNDEEPWYLDADEEYDLYYDLNGHIKGGTKEVLVTHLTNHQNFDAGFTKVFLSTFRSMMTPGELINLLIARFDIQAPEGLSFDEYQIWRQKKAYLIRLRCVNVMKMLLQKYWIDAYSTDRKALETWYAFAQRLTEMQFPMHAVLEAEVKARLEGVPKKGVNMALSVAPPPTEPAPEAILPEVAKHHKNLRLLDVNPLELARQLTVRDSSRYQRITLVQCLARLWKDKYGALGGLQHIAEFISNSNKLTGYVSALVLRSHDASKRAKTIEYFIQVAEHCRKINNFCLMTAIISGLLLSPVHRLHKTWKEVPASAREALDKMNRLMNRDMNFSVYREMLKHVSGVPCVPFVGVYLSDLTFIMTGTPDYLNGDPTVINFYKRLKLELTIGNILAFQSTSYPFQPVETVQEFLLKGFADCPLEELQYKILLILEPREGQKEELPTLKELSEQGDLKEYIDSFEAGEDCADSEEGSDSDSGESLTEELQRLDYEEPYDEENEDEDLNKLIRR